MKEYGDFVSEADRMVIASLREFVREEILPCRQQLDADENRVHVHRVLNGLAAIGMHKRGLPESLGGIRTGAVSFVVGYEEIARGDCGIALTLSVPAWAFGPAVRSRNERVIQDLCPPFCGDTFVEACLAMTEPEGGCNVECAEYRGKAIHTRARLEGEQWVITGAKQFPSGAGVSEAYLIACTTDPELAEEGIALIYVPANTPGLSFSKPEDKMGMRFTDVNAGVYLDGVRVPKEYRASMEPGKDAESLKNLLSWGRLSSAAFSVGAAQGALDIALEFTGQRYYGGKQVRQHSLQAAMLADMMIGVESARFYYLTVASMFDNRKVYGHHFSDEQLGRATGAKVYASEMALKVCHMAMELTGSYGYMRDYHIEKYLRDVKIIQLWEGGAQLGRIDVARGRYPMVAYV